MLKKFIKLIGGDPNKKEVDRLSEVVEQINALEPQFEAISDDALKNKTSEFRALLAARIDQIDDDDERYQAEQDALNEILPEAFAAVREASRRQTGMRPFDVQLIGGMALHQGKIAEMRTGEGKTLVATLPLYLNALTGRGVHLVTVNDYLARRDARWMGQIYIALGMTVGVLQMSGRAEMQKKAYLVDLSHTSPQEDQHHLRLVSRAEAYQADITYGTNSEFGFDYLRDNMVYTIDDKVQRPHHYAIVDEVDNVLIDEARTPLIISGPAQDESEWYIRIAQVVRQLNPEDYELNEKDRNISLTEIGEGHVEVLLDMPLRDPDRPEDLTPIQSRVLGYLEQGLRAQHLFHRNKDYLIQNGKVVIVDEFTGRLMPGRRWSDGLHQAVEAKEGVKVQNESVTYATITLQNYFRMYRKLAGMSGTAMTESEEFDKIYKLGVVSIPTNLEYRATQENSDLVEVEDRDEGGYKYSYFSRRNDPDKLPVRYRRKDYPDIFYRTEESKLRALTREIFRNHVIGRPVLVGTTSVELSDHVSQRLQAEPLQRLAQSLLVREAWLRRNKITEEAYEIPELKFLYSQKLTEMNSGDLRRFVMGLDQAGRGNGKPEGGKTPQTQGYYDQVRLSEPENLRTLLQILNVPESYLPQLESDLKGGIPHRVLNAREHASEGMIIAGAGALGAVTIATNMAGRGVDIKLGGELREDVAYEVYRILHRNGIKDVDRLSIEQRYNELRKLSDEDYGLAAEQIQEFFKYYEDMKEVNALGGLHVIGSERHEARRIDNQLRGRSARQGDPGSSRFYISMEDDLMRRFGGQQFEGVMERLRWDEAVPMEVGLVGRFIEGAQSRVEGYNFDTRKHLLEYDDVLNNQRARIYSERNLILTKDDLTEDVTAMLETELSQHISSTLNSEGGPWALLGWLEQIQPSIPIGDTYYPTYSQRLILDQVKGAIKSGAVQSSLRQGLLDLASDSLNAERDHLVKAIRDQMEKTEERLDEQIEERLDALDTYLEGMDLNEEPDARRPSEILSELSSAVRMPLKLQSDELRQLKDEPRKLKPVLRQQVQHGFRQLTISRQISAIERRIDDELKVSANDLADLSWREVTQELVQKTAERLEYRQSRLLGSDGMISKDLNSLLEKINQDTVIDDRLLLDLLNRMPRGKRLEFTKAHRATQTVVNRLTYIYHAARLLEGQSEAHISESLLEHLQGARIAIQNELGQSELRRLSTNRLFDIEEKVRQVILDQLGIDKEDPLVMQPLKTLDGDLKNEIADTFGRVSMTAVYRQLLLWVVTEQWVDYLTQMEGLRVSIGLEAYAQRDPLVQYKSRAGELYQTLQSSIRLGVVNGMFTYRPQQLTQIPVTGFTDSSEKESSIQSGSDEGAPSPILMTAPSTTPATSAPEATQSGTLSSKKRKRHRH